MTDEPSPTAAYFEPGNGTIRQGNIFGEVPRSVDFPPDAIAVEEGTRFFVSGPFEPGKAMLLTPSCSFAAQGVADGYSHAYRQIAPIQPLEELVEAGAIKPESVGQLRKYDNLRNYLYLPEDPKFEIVESCVLVYAATAIHSSYLTESNRIAQLSPEAEVHLKRHLAAFISGSVFSHSEFDADERA